MCGIMGYAGPRPAAPILIDGLRRLEYRGYDSAGVAVFDGRRLVVRKAEGKLARLAQLLDDDPVPGTTGIGHTRWATHGVPSDQNAHPHTDCAGKIVVVPNPIDIQTVRAKAAEPLADPWPIAQERRVLVSVGRLVKLKGLDSLIRSMPLLDANVSLAIVGNGPERSSLEGLAEDCGVRNRVHFLGLQPNPWQFMAQADIFVLPSLTEGLPRVIGEAMALGLPIVASDCSPSLGEYLGEEEAGLIVHPGDPSALAAAITRLLDDGAMRRQLGQRGLSRIATFDLARSVEALEEAIRPCLAPQGRRRKL